MLMVACQFFPFTYSPVLTSWVIITRNLFIAIGLDCLPSMFLPQYFTLLGNPIAYLFFMPVLKHHITSTETTWQCPFFFSEFRRLIQVGCQCYKPSVFIWLPLFYPLKNSFKVSSVLSNFKTFSLCLIFSFCFVSGFLATRNYTQMENWDIKGKEEMIVCVWFLFF